MTQSLIQDAKDQVATLTQVAYEKAAKAGALPEGVAVDATVEIPKDVRNGDYASTFAMVGAKAFHMAPRAIAQVMAENMDLTGTYFNKVEVAGPGFLNFTLGNKWLGAVLSSIEEQGENYGRCDVGKGNKFMVEFVSANPTGPMHMGNARGGALGDALANILNWAGYDSYKEFYVNDIGNQIEKFAESINARYRQLFLGEDAVKFPEDGYHGEDIMELAKLLREKDGDKWLDAPEKERLDYMGSFGLDINIPKMKEDLLKYRISFDNWFFESSLYHSSDSEETLKLLEEKGCTYEKDGALWLKTGELLREKYRREGKSEEQIEKLTLKDDVLRRSNGFYTYFASDIAYHRNKLEKRGFSIALNIWGADHHGHVARLQAALDGIGLDGSHRMPIVLMHLVNLLDDGKPVRMSKRSGKTIALSNLLDDISVDAARFFFNSRSPGTPLDFDLALAVREDSENPVYYIQYAYARICTLLARMEEEGAKTPAAGEVDVSIFSTPEEKALIKTLSQFPEEVAAVARDYDPSHINRYLLALAADFHRFYTACRIKGEEPKVMEGRLKLAASVRRTLEIGLKLIGVSALEKM